MSLFGNDAMDAIRLAEDEARMLGHSTVARQHLLLAVLRRTRVDDVLNGRVAAGDVFGAIVDQDGLGDELVLGRVPRSRQLDTTLARALEISGERGEPTTTNLHLLLALAECEPIATLLSGFGINDFASLVGEAPAKRASAQRIEMARVALVRSALGEDSKQRYSAVPAFERFTGDARRAIRAAVESAAVLEHRNVDPFHFLIGCAQVREGYAARVLGPVWEEGELGLIGELFDLACHCGPPPFHQATGRFGETARRVVAEDALKLAYRGGHHQITTGHLLLAALDSQDPTIATMTAPHTQRLARSLARGMPGTDAGPDEGKVMWIQFDQLIRVLILDFRNVLPPGWTIWGSGRSGIHLVAPDAPREPGFRIRPQWITAETGPADQRLAQVTRWMLEPLQAAVTQANDGEPWPATADGQPAGAYAEIILDRYNPELRLGYGDPAAPTLTVLSHKALVNMLISSI